MIKQEVLKFLLAGGTAAAANWLSRFVFSTFLPYEAAIVLAFMVGLAVGFSLMRSYVFDARGGSIQKQLPTFVFINLFALLQTLVVSIVLTRWILPAIGVAKQAEAVGHGVGVLVPVLTSYLGHKHLTFK